MQHKALYATIQNGRYIIDEPASFPEGKRLRLVIVEEADELPEDHAMTSEERERLNAALDQSVSELDAGKRHSWDEIKALAQARHK
jgi:hypothetical protein